MFLDEIGRGNSVVRNALLKIILERTLDEIGMAQVTVPLISLFAASNSSMTDDEDLQAFDDRFVLREVVQEIVDDDAFTRMITAKCQAPKAWIDLAQIRLAQEEAAAIRGTREVLDKIIELRHACSSEGISVSPRRWKKALAITKARAWLDGEPEVAPEHLAVLTSVLWRDPDERKAVERLVYQAACPIYLTALEAEDSVTDLVKNLPEPGAANYEEAVENCLMQIADCHADLDQHVQRSRVKNLERAKKSLQTIAAVHEGLARDIKKRMQRMQLRSA